MQIQWVRYKKASGQRYLLALVLGTRNHRTCILECQKVPNNEVKLLRAIMPQLATVSLGQQIAWIKAHCPTSYRLAYKELMNNQLDVLQKY